MSNSESVHVHSRISTTKKCILALLVLIMIALHQDFWLWNNAYPVFGFLPIGLAYHAGYSLLVAVLMWTLVRHAWPTELEEEAAVPQDGKSPEAQP